MLKEKIVTRNDFSYSQWRKLNKIKGVDVEVGDKHTEVGLYDTNTLCGRKETQVHQLTCLYNTVTRTPALWETQKRPMTTFISCDDGYLLAEWNLTWIRKWMNVELRSIKIWTSSKVGAMPEKNCAIAQFFL